MVQNETTLSILANIESSHLAGSPAVRSTTGLKAYARIVFQRLSTDAIQFSALVPIELLTPGIIEYHRLARDSAGRSRYGTAALCITGTSPSGHGHGETMMRGGDATFWPSTLIIVRACKSIPSM